MNSDYLAPLGALMWGVFMLSVGLYAQRQYRLQHTDDDEQLFREVYGPAGKPKKPATGEPEPPTRSAE